MKTVADSRLEERLPAQILASSRDIVLVKDRRSRLVWANQGYLDFWGLSLDQIRGRRAAPPSPNGPEPFLADDATVFRTGRALVREEEAVTAPDGRTRWLRTVKTPLLNEQGQATLLVVVARDVTEKRAYRIALDRINECLLASGPDPLENISRLTGLCGELLGADCAVYNRLEKGILSAVGQWNVPEDFNPVREADGSLCGDVAARGADEPLFACLLGKPRGGPRACTTYAGRAVRRDGRTHGVLSALFDGDVQPGPVFAKVMGILAAAIAAEEERLGAGKAHARLTDELRQAHKMEAVGRLAGGIAHDFNNTLTTIKGYAEMLRAGAGTAEARTDAAEVLKAVDFAASLTRQLLAFGRRQMLVPRPLDLAEVVRGAARMLTRLIGEDVRLVVELPDSPLPVYADPSQLEQVLVNLALNARDAMPDGGALTVRAREAAESEVPPDEDGAPASGRYIALSVADDGVGISPEILPHIFEPFFTTKEKGKGTGLGLATVYGVVAQSGGRLSCESAPERGTTFRIWLPRCEAALRPAAAAETVSDLRGRGRVLLVEDDAAIRQMLARALKTAGYEVAAAANADEALSLEAGREIDVLVTDVVMPGRNGRQLAMALEKRRPGLKVLYMSGYTDDAAFRSALRPGTAFLQKPFNPSDLCRKLKELLAAAGAP
ncbi:MAG: response regulator [Elusimicrobia bacterium]|nr:response regulator [Elusimicrobiota bacterium]